ncbi:MAG: flagellar export protein FliJ [Woeseia sp.]
MKNRSHRLGRIVALARSEEQRQGAALGKSRNKYDEQMQRLGELNAYKYGYQQRSRSVSGATSAHWQDYQNFLRRMDLAVKSQQEIVQDAELNLQKHRQRWTQKRQRVDSLQRVLESYRGEEELHAERLRQRALDELPLAADPYPSEG